jgi:tetratricopeptide (TPR) repeat protein
METPETAQDPEIESSLRTCIKLNPGFAPAYDALAMHYSTDPAKTSEAHMLNIQAILLEPDNLNYRLNAAAVFMRAQRYDDAIHVLQAAIHVAKTPEQVAAVQSRIDQIEQFQASVARSHEANSEAAAQTAGVTVIDTRTITVKSNDGRLFVIKPNTPSEGPKYPTEAPNGPHHTARGILRNVQCSYPSILTLKVDPADKAPAILLYRNDFRQIEFTVTNFTPKSDINPCTDIQGLKAKVEYAEVSDKSIAGQIISIELSK